MSYYLVIDNKTFDQIGSNAGYSDFGRWVDSIDAERYLELVHLYEHGACFNLDDLESTIEDAIDTVGPHVADVRSTVDNLLTVVKSRPKGAKVCYVTDGLGPDDGDDGDDGASEDEDAEPATKAVTLGQIDQKGFGPHEFSSTQVQLPPEVAAVLSTFGGNIPDDEIDPEGGIEIDCHVTLVYGL